MSSVLRSFWIVLTFFVHICFTHSQSWGTSFGSAVIKIVGADEGASVGAFEGAAVGTALGECDGVAVGAEVGVSVGV